MVLGKGCRRLLSGFWLWFLVAIDNHAFRFRSGVYSLCLCAVRRLARRRFGRLSFESVLRGLFRLLTTSRCTRCRANLACWRTRLAREKNSEPASFGAACTPFPPSRFCVIRPLPSSLAPLRCPSMLLRIAAARLAQQPLRTRPLHLIARSTRISV